MLFSISLFRLKDKWSEREDIERLNHYTAHNPLGATTSDSNEPPASRDTCDWSDHRTTNIVTGEGVGTAAGEGKGLGKTFGLFDGGSDSAEVRRERYF